MQLTLTGKYGRELRGNMIKCRNKTLLKGEKDGKDIYFAEVVQA